MNILEKLRSLDEGAPIPPSLPTEEQVRYAEEKLEVRFPPSYVQYQLGYADVSFGPYELFHLLNNGDDLDLINNVTEAREQDGLDRHLLPFVTDNGDYFCFDLQSPAPEYEVVYWSHNGAGEERWKNFLDWVEHCWIKEGLETDDDMDV